LDEEKPQQPFDQLGQEDQKALIDVAVMLIALTTRVPTIKGIYDAVRAEFIRSYHLSNSAKYALHHVTDELMNSNWELTIRKKGVRLITSYTKLQSDNGEAHIQ
jgi:hypothetical protein